jgi:putative transcriptional regulator
LAREIKMNVFGCLRDALQDAVAFEREQKVNLRVTELPAPPRAVSPNEIWRIRQALNASQQVFASYLNVSTNAVRTWEQGTRPPQHAALKLLAIANKNPQALLSA